MHDRIKKAGAAVDLGTTEIRISLWDLGRKQCIARHTAPNPQVCRGTDILSRLSSAAASPVVRDELGRLAGNSLAALLRELCRETGTPRSSLRAIAIAGNTAMLALLTGRDVEQLLHPGMWGRRIDVGFADPAATAEDWGLDAGCTIEIVQPLAGFVGSDLLAGMLAVKLIDGPAGTLLLDFGANTEIALWDGMRIWATSAAGGPAFEGCGISRGMTATTGAVRSIVCDGPDGRYSFDVIGGGKAAGLCGSGLVDAVACLLKRGRLTPAGRSTGGAQRFVLDEGGTIVVTGQDIDALQRAKAGVAAAIRILMQRAGLAFSELRRVCVGGALGSSLDVANAIFIGLLPPVDDGCVELCGNTALAGCELILVGENNGTGERSKTTVVNMSYLQEYEDVFIDNLLLQHWNEVRKGSVICSTR